MGSWVVFTALCVIALLAAERSSSVALRATTKLAASTGFLLVAWQAGAVESAFGRAILAGLACSWVGDACLLSARRGPFVAGLAAFLAAHLLYLAAFLATGPALTWLLLALLPLALTGAVVWRWLRPVLEGSLRLPVAAYVVAISAMVAAAFGAYGGGARAGVVEIPAGAVAFFLSDLAVARDRFVAPGWINRLWGLPLYYAGQILLASSVG